MKQKNKASKVIYSCQFFYSANGKIKKHTVALDDELNNIGQLNQDVTMNLD